MIFVDTTFLIDFLRGKKEAIAVLEREQATPLYTSEINVFEVVTGIYVVSNQKKDFEKLWALFSSIVVLPLDRRGACKAGEIAASLIKSGQKIEDTDCLIAGIMLSNAMNKIITRNKEHYERISGITVVTY